MASKHRIDVRLATQILLLQLAVVALTLGSRVRTRRSGAPPPVDRRIRSSVARHRTGARLRAGGTRGGRHYDAVGTPPAAELARGPLQRVATQVRLGTGSLFVVITNDRGIRLSHPNVEELGKRVSTDPSALSGGEQVVQQTGTLGPSIRAKVPVLAPGSDRVVGQVSVGMSTSSVYELLRSNQRGAAITGGPALLLGVVLCVLLARRWREQTLDLQPRR